MGPLKPGSGPSPIAECWAAAAARKGLEEAAAAAAAAAAGEEADEAAAAAARPNDIKEAKDEDFSESLAAIPLPQCRSKAEEAVLGLSGDIPMEFNLSLSSGGKSDNLSSPNNSVLMRSTSCFKGP